MDERSGTAFEEAGHAVVAILNRSFIDEVSIEPRGGSKGHTRIRHSSRLLRRLRAGKGYDKREALRELENTFAGALAKARYEGRLDDEIRQFADGKLDLSEDLVLLELKIASRFRGELRPLVEAAFRRAAELLCTDENWRAVDQLAQALLMGDPTIGGERACEIVTQALPS